MKKRLDQILVDNGLVESKTKAQALVMAGQVYVNGELSDKAGRPTTEDAQICIKELFPYVSRGALKLEKALQEFNLTFKNKIVCDIGSSTGGFTDYSLQNGAKKVYAIDVGTGQLAQKIREDSRVVVMEQTDFRSIEAFSETIDIFVCDVSFISLKKIIPKIEELIMTKKEVVLLIKPQFEAGAKDVSKGKGVIKDNILRENIVEDIKKFAKALGFKIAGLTESPITGAKGNVEYLLYLVKYK